MRICDLTSGTIRLQRALSKLREKWDEAKTDWNDQNTHDFEAAHLHPLVPLLAQTSAAIQRLTELLDKAERDLVDEPPAGS